MIDGQVHHFSVGGLSNGLAILRDDESGTYWDHITGEALQGPLQGQRLDCWPIRLTTVEAALAEDPDLEISLSPHRSLRSWLMQLVHRRKIHTRGWLPLPFRLTMTHRDDRLPEMTQGLGVVVAGSARYYPITAIPASGLEDDWGGRSLRISKGALDGVPAATWADTGERPFQLLSRWYGFSYTFPGCEIYRPDVVPHRN